MGVNNSDAQQTVIGLNDSPLSAKNKKVQSLTDPRMLLFSKFQVSALFQTSDIRGNVSRTFTELNMELVFLRENSNCAGFQTKLVN